MSAPPCSEMVRSRLRRDFRGRLHSRSSRPLVFPTTRKGVHCSRVSGATLQRMVFFFFFPFPFWSCRGFLYPDYRRLSQEFSFWVFSAVDSFFSYSRYRSGDFTFPSASNLPRYYGSSRVDKYVFFMDSCFARVYSSPPSCSFTDAVHSYRIQTIFRSLVIAFFLAVLAVIIRFSLLCSLFLLIWLLWVFKAAIIPMSYPLDVFLEELFFFRFPPPRSSARPDISYEISPLPFFFPLPSGPSQA